MMKKKKKQSTPASSEMMKLQFEAARKAADYESKQKLYGLDQEVADDGRRAIQKKALSGASKRAYYQELKKVVEISDVIIEVLDARDPMGGRCMDIEKMIMTKDKDKRIILLLNKIDLVPREVLEQWLRYFRSELPTLAFKSNTQMQKLHLSRNGGGGGGSSSQHGKGSNKADCIGGEMLLQLLKNYARSLNMKKTITVGIIGYPNVGKSSVINSLKKERVAFVGNTPGLTKMAQEIKLDRDIKLVDCPGIVFDNDELDTDAALKNCVRIEQLSDPVPPSKKKQFTRSMC